MRVSGRGEDPAPGQQSSLGAQSRKAQSDSEGETGSKKSRGTRWGRSKPEVPDVEAGGGARPGRGSWVTQWVHVRFKSLPAFISGGGGQRQRRETGLRDGCAHPASCPEETWDGVLAVPSWEPWERGEVTSGGHTPFVEPPLSGGRPPLPTGWQQAGGDSFSPASLTHEAPSAVAT